MICIWVKFIFRLRDYKRISRVANSELSLQIVISEGYPRICNNLMLLWEYNGDTRLICNPQLYLFLLIFFHGYFEVITKTKNYCLSFGFRSRHKGSQTQQNKFSISISALILFSRFTLNKTKKKRPSWVLLSCCEL